MTTHGVTNRRSATLTRRAVYDDDEDAMGGGAYERDRDADRRASSAGRRASTETRDRMANVGRRGGYDAAPSAKPRGPNGPNGRYIDDDGMGDGGGGPGRELNKFLIAGAFVIGIGAGVVFDTAVDLEPSNVASREILDRRTPSSELCMANGASAMVFDQRVFLSLNPFNVYVAQPEVKPGCVLRRSNWSVLERRDVVDKKAEEVCKSHMNTFAFVGDLDKSPEVSCVYHSEDAENQFMKDPSKAVLGDGVVQTMRERIDEQQKSQKFR